MLFDLGRLDGLLFQTKLVYPPLNYPKSLKNRFQPPKKDQKLDKKAGIGRLSHGMFGACKDL